MLNTCSTTVLTYYGHIVKDRLAITMFQHFAVKGSSSVTFTASFLQAKSMWQLAGVQEMVTLDVTFNNANQNSGTAVAK